MLRGSKENECPYSESNVPEMLDKFMEKGLKKLLESKHPEEIERSNYPKYLKYHRIISHPIQTCNTFKRQVLQLRKEGKITIGEEETEESD